MDSLSKEKEFRNGIYEKEETSKVKAISNARVLNSDRLKAVPHSADGQSSLKNT